MTGGDGSTEGVDGGDSADSGCGISAAVEGGGGAAKVPASIGGAAASAGIGSGKIELHASPPPAAEDWQGLAAAAPLWAQPWRERPKPTTRPRRSRKPIRKKKILVAFPT